MFCSGVSIVDFCKSKYGIGNSLILQQTDCLNMQGESRLKLNNKEKEIFSRENLFSTYAKLIFPKN